MSTGFAATVCVLAASSQKVGSILIIFDFCINGCCILTICSNNSQMSYMDKICLVVSPPHQINKVYGHPTKQIQFSSKITNECQRNSNTYKVVCVLQNDYVEYIKLFNNFICKKIEVI
jgi:hypothetical protein